MTTRATKGATRGTRIGLALVGALLVAGLAAAQPAGAEIVWSKGGDIWAMHDDGSGQRLLISRSAAGMDALRDPAVFPGGSTVFFSGETTRNKVTRTGLCGTFPMTYSCITTHYGFNSTGTYRWDGGTVQRLSPEPAYCWNCTDGTSEPEPRADGSYVASFLHCQGFFDDGSYECLGSIVSSNGASYPAVCNGEGLTGDLPAGASPDPAAPDVLVYVGCGAGGQPSALIVTGPDHGGERIVACDDTTQSDPSWSPSGQEIVAAEGGAEAGLWVYGAANNGCFSGQLRQAVVAPAGVSFSDPRFVGSDAIVFAAQGELWKVSAGCSSCAFPGAATQLTSGGDNASPGWTSDPLLAPSPNPNPSDTTAPKLTFKLSKRQRVLRQGGKLVLKLRADEACKLTVGGKIIAPPGKSLRLRQTTRSLTANTLTTVRLKLSKKALKAVKRSWRRHRVPAAALGILAEDGSGNTTKATRRIALVR